MKLPLFCYGNWFDSHLFGACISFRLSTVVSFSECFFGLTFLFYTENFANLVTTVVLRLHCERYGMCTLRHFSFYLVANVYWFCIYVVGETKLVTDRVLRDATP